MTPTLLPARIEGDGLLLRHWTVADEQALGKVIERNLDHLRPWMPWIAKEPLSAAERIAIIESWAEEAVAGGDSMYGIFVGPSIVGGCGLHRRIGPEGLEIGYWTSASHLRQGIASRSARLLTTSALQLPGISVVEIHHDKDNRASAAVPRRLGFHYVGDVSHEALAPGETGTHSVWRTTTALWNAR